MEDLFVRPTYRGEGIGFVLFQRIAQTAAEQGCRRIDLAVLDWNQEAIDFYDALGAEPLDDWTIMHLEEDTMEEVAVTRSRDNGV